LAIAEVPDETIDRKVGGPDKLDRVVFTWYPRHDRLQVSARIFIDHSDRGAGRICAVLPVGIEANDVGTRLEMVVHIGRCALGSIAKVPEQLGTQGPTGAIVEEEIAIAEVVGHEAGL